MFAWTASYGSMLLRSQVITTNYHKKVRLYEGDFIEIIYTKDTKLSDILVFKIN